MKPQILKIVVAILTVVCSVLFSSLINYYSQLKTKKMKKNLENLVQKLQQGSTGKLEGGFGSIKGGMSMQKLANNSGDCTNKVSCSGTNSNTCTNSGDCHLSTNNTPGACTNSNCFN